MHLPARLLTAQTSLTSDLSRSGCMCSLAILTWHPAAQELKGNIRVFARVRPADDEQASALELGGLPVVAFPSDGVPRPLVFEQTDKC